jgi:hypothetical protein
MILLTAGGSLLKALSVSLCLCVEPVLPILNVQSSTQRHRDTETQRTKTEKLSLGFLVQAQLLFCTYDCLEHVSESHDDASIATIGSPLVKEIAGSYC